MQLRVHRHVCHIEINVKTRIQETALRQMSGTDDQSPQ